MTVRRRLKLSFVAVVCVALGVTVLNYLQYGQLKGDARTLNLAGSQRMRSYRLAVLASRCARDREPAVVDAIHEELARFRSILVALRYGSVEEGLKPAPNEHAKVALTDVEDEFRRLEQRLRYLLQAVRAGDRKGSEQAAQEITVLASGLAGRMDVVVSAFEQASASAVQRNSNMQLVLFAAITAIALLSFKLAREALIVSLPVLEGGVQELARGRLGTKVSIDSGIHEITRFAEAFNDMSGELARAREQIVTHEAELAQRNDELIRANRVKSEFIATMSHELRTPLTAVLGFADLLQRRVYGPLSDDQAERLEAILRNARHLHTLIGNVLDLAKIEAQQLEASLEPVAPAPLVQEVAESLRPAAERKKLGLAVVIGEDLPQVNADHLRQIMLNLLANAVKYTDAGKVEVRVNAAADNDYCLIEVEDTGKGIAAAQLPLLFQPFKQLDGSDTRRYGGVGLGLHISKRLADLCGARIEVESEAGRGSCFSLLLRSWQGDLRQTEADTATAVGSTVGEGV
ncbi:ATP-binding protein [Planctomycetota bacterium]